LQLDDVKKLEYLFPFINIIFAKWHYQYLPGVYLEAYIKDEVIIVQNKKVKAKMQLTGPLRPYDATEGLIPSKHKWPDSYLGFKPPINNPGFESKFTHCTQVEQR
jgi:hypothetical protein